MKNQENQIIMKNSKMTLVMNMLKETTAYDLHQIGIEQEKQRIIIHSKNNNGVFFHTELCALVIGINISNYIQWNEEENRCELVLF